uniref:Cytochrome P450 n=1 Tax=Mycena chlorophos TaxID=658473 RepID=A0ABQ0LL57_MYCCL|nr:cytochrome P450 [Mycena chlorophos]
MSALLALTAALAALYLLRRSSKQTSVDALPGPTSTSWLFGAFLDGNTPRMLSIEPGNLRELLLSPVYGQHEFRWQEEYGTVYALRGCFNQSRLMVSDPAALRFIANTQAFTWGFGQRKASQMLFGDGNLFLARGERHKYLRAVMNPWFSQRSVRNMLPIMKDTARKLTDSWESEMNGPGSPCIDVSRGVHTSSLDILGEVLLETPINGLRGESDLSRIQRELTDSAAILSPLGLIAEALMPYIPDWLFRVAPKLPFEALRQFREYWTVTDEMASAVTKQVHNLGEDHKQINKLVTVAAGSMSDEEVSVHVRTMLITGDDTTGNSITWALYELARLPTFQANVRAEIRAAVQKSGPEEIDYEGLPLLNALINVPLFL